MEKPPPGALAQEFRLRILPGPCIGRDSHSMEKTSAWALALGYLLPVAVRMISKIRHLVLGLGYNCSVMWSSCPFPVGQPVPQQYEEPVLLHIRHKQLDLRQMVDFDRERPLVHLTAVHSFDLETPLGCLSLMPPHPPCSFSFEFPQEPQLPKIRQPQ